MTAFADPEGLKGILNPQKGEGETCGEGRG